MDYYLFSAQNATVAQHMAQILSRYGITGQIQRMPALLTRQGCSFALRIAVEDAGEARRCLGDHGMVSRHIYLRENGVYREVSI